MLTASFVGLVLAAGADATADEFFEKEVRPLLVERCQTCHGDAKPRGGLRLTSREAVLKGGDNGPAAVAGKPDASLLVKAVRYTDDRRMPPKGKLTEREIATLTRWVQLGMPWPDSKPAVVGDRPKFRITDEQRAFWSFRHVREPKVPAVKDNGWAKSDLDRFVLAKLEAQGLKPARPADKRTLIRRATFDLTGLPPTPEEVEAFVKDETEGAFAKVVDRLLGSPAYGERWGRHWLDLVRYADSFDARGIGGEMDVADAWRYRDWVIDAFNRDRGYDGFLTDQIAGDILSAKEKYDRARVIATGFLAIGNWGGGDADKEKLLTDVADDQVDAVTRTFLGLTVACARCHDHKFDPISQADYYGLAGMFFSTHILPNVGPKTNGPPVLRIPLLPPDELARREAAKKTAAELDMKRKAEAARHAKEYAGSLREKTADYLLAAWDYEHRAGDEAKLSADEFAVKRGLVPFALRQWVETTGGGGEGRLLTTPVRNVLDKAGVHGWRGSAPDPALLVNTTDAEVSILTFKLPPKEVSVHPGPRGPIAVAWRGPIDGVVTLKGKLTDADPNCGDGVAWVIEHRRGRQRTELASGEFANGGSRKFDQGKGAKQLEKVDIQEGDRLELVVLPKANHSCDTTVVELEIALADRSKTWNLARDLTDDPLKGNPHADRHGNAGVWSVLDMAEGRKGAKPEAISKALSDWDRVAAAEKPTRADLEKTADAAAKDFPADADGSPFLVRRREDEAALPADARAALAKLDADIAAAKAESTKPIDYANGAQEGGVPGSPHAGTHDVHLHVRGRYDRLGDLIPRRFPEILAGDKQTPIKDGSGRLELARWIASKDNPLTGRVMANRLWQFHFGESIVRTPSNFGFLGEKPTHPELLDWLAARFVEKGWSIKAMHRLLMLSATYQQTSVADPMTRKADPDNRLFGRMNRRRLEAEPVRDSILAVAGKLDGKMGGPAVRDLASPRRTVYLMTVRSDRSGFGPLFDAADSTALVDKRTVSTVAPQALFLLNDPFIVAQTKSLAKRVREAGKDDVARVGYAYRLLYGRPPTTAEDRLGREFVKGGDERAWEEYCQVLLCANEFVYVD